jgi:hypothetical protein
MPWRVRAMGPQEVQTDKATDGPENPGEHRHTRRATQAVLIAPALDPLSVLSCGLLKRQGRLLEWPLLPNRGLRRIVRRLSGTPELCHLDRPLLDAPELDKLRLRRMPLRDTPELCPGAAEILLLGVDAVDLARASAQERHLGTPAVARAPRTEAPRVRPEAEARRNPTSGRLRADGKHRVVVRPIDRRRPGERL